MPLVYSIIHARLETIFTTMSCFTFVPTCKNGWHIVQLLGKKMAIAENAKQTTLKWLACTLFKVGIFQIIKSFQQSNHFRNGSKFDTEKSFLVHSIIIGTDLRQTKNSFVLAKQNAFPSQKLEMFPKSREVIFLHEGPGTKNS